MSFPFSFSSFGDIITAADLALRIAKALSSSAGSSYEYQYLIQELSALSYVLQLADTATRTGMLHRDVVNGIVAEISRCRSVMDGLWERVRGYQKALGSSNGGGGSSWRKIGWALFKTQDVQDTRMKLSTHRLALVTLMTACNLQTLDDLRAQSVRFERSLHRRLDEIYTVVRQLPQKLGHTRTNAVLLQDWRGSETVLPVEFCQSAAQIRMLLNAVAQKWPTSVRRYIQGAVYDLVCEETNMMLGSRNEPSFLAGILPGSTLRMLGFFEVNGPKADESTAGTETDECMTLGVNYRYCDTCRTRGQSCTLSAFQAVDKQPHTLYVGCGPDYAQWKIIIEDTPDSDQIYKFHDPTCVDCAISDIGLPAASLIAENFDDRGLFRYPLPYYKYAY
ncbi:hypothetical protein C8Q80DRAFT_1271780 [Daedaleopsis nitida]|nr:hypothetical protein C8Q80DRAFT_1271780 [Daedaleopsis nitida]